MCRSASSITRPPSTAGGAVSGTGIGLRSPHIKEVLNTRPDVPWFEILADNHSAPGGRIVAELEQIRAHYPITFHCVGMSLGSVDPLDREYLKNLKTMMAHYQPAWVSDHLCFTHLGGEHYHDLLPLPYTEEALQHLGDRIAQVQDFLGERLLVENVSSYVNYAHSTLSEAEFLGALCERADCDLLLDVNNIHVSAFNHGFSATAFLDAVPLERVREVHLAGYEDMGPYLLDAHNHAVSEPVWSLFNELVRRAPHIPALIEWDNDIPSLQVLMNEAGKAESIVRMHEAARA